MNGARSHGDMDEPIAVVALDAADYALASEWGCENILLDRAGPLETDNFSHHKPLTTEVWPAIATGKDVSEFGAVAEQQWDNPLLRAGSQVTRHLPSGVRYALGAPFRLRGERTSFTEVGHNHPFDAVEGWPGMSAARHLDEAWMWMRQMKDGELTEGETLRMMRANTGREFGWAAAMAHPETPLVGVHSHVLDVAGHTYARRPERLREVYEWVDAQLGWLREAVPELVVLSDHGMQTTLLDDDDPGIHSWRATVAATDGLEGDLPETIYEVSAWLRANRAPPSEASTETATMDVPTEHLKDLGYMD